jgi:hypothetical protein
VKVLCGQLHEALRAEKVTAILNVDRIWECRWNVEAKGEFKVSSAEHRVGQL